MANRIHGSRKDVIRILRGELTMAHIAGAFIWSTTDEGFGYWASRSKGELNDEDKIRLFMMLPRLWDDWEK